MAFRTRDSGTALRGFSELQRALEAIEHGANDELRRRLRLVGEGVANVARADVSHKSGRHFGRPAIEESVRVAVNRTSAAVYSTAPHGGVQNVGGKVGRGHLTVLRRSDVSGYMNKAVKSSHGFVEHELDGVLDWVEKEFGRG